MPRALTPLCAYFTPIKGQPTGLEFVDSTSLKVCHNLREQGVELITQVRKNMKAKLLSAWDRAMLSKRFIIETLNDQFKNVTQIEHSRHRSVHGFMLNLVGGLVAYCLKDNKPSLNIDCDEFQSLVMA